MFPIILQSDKLYYCHLFDELYDTRQWQMTGHYHDHNYSIRIGQDFVLIIDNYVHVFVSFVRLGGSRARLEESRALTKPSSATAQRTATTEVTRTPPMPAVQWLRWRVAKVVEVRNIVIYDLKKKCLPL